MGKSRSNSTRDNQSRNNDFRESETRDMNVRAAETDRTEYNMEYVSRLHIPAHVQKPGYEYFWERRSLRGQIDYAVDRSCSRGWSPVPKDRDPSPTYSSIHNDPMSERFMCRADAMLLEREEAIGKAERAALAREATERLEGSRAYNFNPDNAKRNALKLN